MCDEESDANATAALTFFPRICRPALLSPPRSATSFSLGLTTDRGKADTADNECSCKGFASMTVVQHNSNTLMTNTVVDNCIVCSCFFDIPPLSSRFNQQPMYTNSRHNQMRCFSNKYGTFASIFASDFGSTRRSLVAASLTQSLRCSGFCANLKQRRATAAEEPSHRS